jgi:hypothetical protein
MSDDDLRTLYVAQRDKHLGQLMAINTRAIFTVLVSVVSILIGFDKVNSLKLPKCSAIWAASLFLLGTVMLLIAAVRMSSFHVIKIRMLENKSWSIKAPAEDDFHIVPPSDWKSPFPFIFVGILCLILAVVIPLTHRLLE